MRAITITAALTAATILAGCGPRGDDQETGSISRDNVLQARDALDPAVVAALDSGNAAYRARRFEDARRHYIDATTRDDDVAAAWFGLYMAELALGNAQAAEAAMDRARQRAPGASLIHPTDTDTVP